MFSSPELISPKGKSEQRPEQETYPESESLKLKEALIQEELMRRSEMKQSAWGERYGHAFHQLFIYPENQQLFLDLYEDDPEALYKLLDEIISKNN